MKNYTLLFGIACIFCNCTSVKHSVFPAYGYGFQQGDQLIIAKFQHAPDDAFSENATQALIKTFQSCRDVTVIPYDSVQEYLYSNLFYTSPIWEIDTKLMIHLFEATHARYLLVGKVLNRSKSNPPISIAEAYGNGQTEDMHENWTTFQFNLYDLATTKIVLTAQTKVKAGHYNYTDDHGDIISFHAATDLFSKALKEGISNTAQSCHCP